MFCVYNSCLLVRLVTIYFEIVFVDCGNLIFRTIQLLIVAFVNSCLFTRYTYVMQKSNIVSNRKHKNSVITCLNVL